LVSKLQAFALFAKIQSIYYLYICGLIFQFRFFVGYAIELYIILTSVV